jgi:hypothetical protein
MLSAFMMRMPRHYLRRQRPEVAGRQRPEVAGWERSEILKEGDTAEPLVQLLPGLNRKKRKISFSALNLLQYYYMK